MCIVRNDQGKIFTSCYLQVERELYRDSNMSAHVFLNLLNELGKRDKMRGLPSILSIFATSLINSIIQENEC